MKDRDSLLTELRKQREGHYQSTANPMWCRNAGCTSWPCPASRALDCAIAGVEELAGGEDRFALSAMAKAWYAGYMCEGEESFTVAEDLSPKGGTR